MSQGDCSSWSPTAPDRPPKPLPGGWNRVRCDQDVLQPVHAAPWLRTIAEGRIIVSSTDTRDTRTPLTPRQRRRTIAKLIFVLAGTASLALSVSLWFLTDDRETAIFVGLWVPSLFSLGALVAAGEGGR